MVQIGVIKFFRTVTPPLPRFPDDMSSSQSAPMPSEQLAALLCDIKQAMNIPLREIDRYLLKQ